MFAVVWLVALLVIHTNSRLILALGLTVAAVGGWICAHLDTSWAGISFETIELLLAAGFACSYVGLVSTIVLEGLEAGALTSATNAATFSGFMHFIRIFGGQVGVAVMTRFVSVREQFHSNMLGLHVEIGNWLTGRTPADAQRRIVSGLRGVRASTTSGDGDSGSTSASPGLHAGNIRWIHPGRLDGGRLSIADVVPAAGKVQLQGPEVNAMKLTNSLRTLAIAGLAMFLAIPQHAADVRHLTLTEAVHLAISQNRALKIARLKVVENEQKKAGEHSSYFPKITNQSNVLHVTDLQNIGIPAGAFGVVGGSLVPAQGVTLPQGQNTFFTSGTQISQPLTQLIRIHAANRIAAAEVASSRDDLKKAENEVALEVHTLYFGILIARLQKQAAEQQTTYAGEQSTRERRRRTQWQCAESSGDTRPRGSA